MSNDAASFSAGVDRVLRSLHPGHAPEGTRMFPQGLDFRQLVMRGDQDLRDVFRRVVDRSLEGRVERCQIEENLAIFAGVAWEHDKRFAAATSSP